MNSSLSTLSGSLLEIVSDILDTLEQLHTASIEFTVSRDNGRPVGLEVHLRYLLAEQNHTCAPKKDGTYVKKGDQWFKFEE